MKYMASRSLEQIYTVENPCRLGIQVSFLVPVSLNDVLLVIFYLYSIKFRQDPASSLQNIWYILYLSSFVITRLDLHKEIK